MNEKPRARSALVYVVGFIALAVLPVLALNSLATADTAATASYSYGAASGTPRHARPHLTPALRQCLTAHGVTFPTAPAGGPRAPLTQAQRDAWHAAAVACGLGETPNGRHPATNATTGAN